MLQKENFPDFYPELPEIDFSISAQGITIHSSRFKEARFLEFDVKGRCKLCNSNTVDVEYYVTEGGIEICSSRFKTRRFILFEQTTPLPNRALFRVRMKGQRFNIPYERNEQAIIDNIETPANGDVVDGKVIKNEV